MKKNILFIVALMTILSLFTGCMAPMMLGGVSPLKHRSETNNFNASFTVVTAAVQSVLTDQDLPVTKEDQDKEGKLRIESRFSDGTGLSIKITSVARNLTEVSVKAGTFGDSERSKWIMNEIRNRL